MATGNAPDGGLDVWIDIAELDVRNLRGQTRMRTVPLLTLAIAVVLSGCIAPVPGNVIETTEPPTEFSGLGPAEKFTAIGWLGSQDDGDIPQCVRKKLTDAVGAERLLETETFRQANLPGLDGLHQLNEIRPAFWVALWGDATARAQISEWGLRFVVLVNGDTSDTLDFELGPFAAGGKKSSRITAHIMDFKSQNMSDRYEVRTAGKWLFTVAPFVLFAVVVPTTETTACKRISKFLAAALTATGDRATKPGNEPVSLKQVAGLYDQAQRKESAALAEIGRLLQLGPGEIGKVFADVEIGKRFKLALSTDDQDTQIAVLREFADQGYPPAQAELGKRLLHGQENSHDIERAKTLLYEAANAGDASARNTLERWETQQELSRNRTRSLAEWQATADGGDVKSQLELAERYRYGREVQKDLGQAIRWYVRAAVAGDDYAPYALGNIYADGETGVVNPSHAYKWYSIAARVSSDDSEELDQRKRELTDIMSPDDVAEAERLAREWTQAHPK